MMATRHWSSAWVTVTAKVNYKFHNIYAARARC